MLKLCIFGNPVDHSLSPWIHRQFANQKKSFMDYIKIKASIHDFPALLENFKNARGNGCNITAPCKEIAYQIADKVSSRAEFAKAVNTMKIFSDGTLYGDNTDGIGFMRDMEKRLNYSFQNKTLLILGAGGAVRGILPPLLEKKPKKIMIANRNEEKAVSLVKAFHSTGVLSPLTEFTTTSFEKLSGKIFDCILDATSLFPENLLPDDLKLSPNALCYDLKYAGGKTAFMQWAEKKGASLIQNGLGMLVEQAAEAFFIWTGEMPETKTVLEKIHAMCKRYTVTN